MLDILPTLGSKGAAYIARYNSEVMRRLLKNSIRQNISHSMRILDVRVKRDTGSPCGHTDLLPAGLHVLSVNPRYDVSSSYNMTRGLERAACLRPVSDFEHMRYIVGTFIPNGGRGRRDREVARRDSRALVRS